MKRVLSLIQPTGDLHLGNYFGAVQNYERLQSSYHCVYGVADYHSMTMPYKAAQLRENTWKMAFYLLACGVKMENLFTKRLSATGILKIIFHCKQLTYLNSLLLVNNSPP